MLAKKMVVRLVNLQERAFWFTTRYVAVMQLLIQILVLLNAKE